MSTKTAIGAISSTSFPIIDVQHSGMGDAVVGCWMIKSAELAGYYLMMNPGNNSAIPSMLGVNPDHISNVHGKHWTETPDLGLRYEYRRYHEKRSRRFDYWCESLGL